MLTDCGIPKPKFKIGDKVTAIGFTDASGKWNSAITDLTVSSAKLFQGAGIKPYYRILAVDSKGFSRCEAAERFFDLA